MIVLSVKALHKTLHGIFNANMQLFMSGYLGLTIFRDTRFPADTLVLAGTAGAGGIAPPTSTRTSATLERVQEHSSPVNMGDPSQDRTPRCYVRPHGYRRHDARARCAAPAVRTRLGWRALVNKPVRRHNNKNAACWPLCWAVFF